MRLPSILIAVSLTAIMSMPSSGGPRDAQWKEVEEAQSKDQPKTVAEKLRPIQAAAFAEKAWGEGTKALAIRLLLEGRIEGGPNAAIKKLDAEIGAVPVEARPILRALQARWFFAYYRQNQWRFLRRSATAQPPGEDFETWDLPRILAEIDKRFQESLADKDALRKIPVDVFGDLFEKGQLGDACRPTLYDFIAHTALEFYSMEVVSAAKPTDAFAIDPASPALGPVEEFLAWKPESTDAGSPKLRALHLYQDLLAFHAGDRDRSAFLHCDLERIRWAGEAAAGEAKADRLDAALRSFIASNAKDPVSADARQDVAATLREADKPKEAHAMAKAGADAFPGHAFGKLCANIVKDLESKALDVRTESNWTPAGADIDIDHRNLGRVWFRAYRRDWSPGKATLDNDPVPDNEDAMKSLLGGKPALAWDAPLPDDQDFADRTTRLAAPKDLAPGFYIIVASGQADFTLKDNNLAATGVHVTKLALVVRRTDNGLDGFVTDAVTGTPLSGIEVGAWQDRSRLPGASKETGQTKADGFFSVKGSPGHGQVMVVARQGDERAVVRTWTGGRQRDPQPRDVIVFFTDRALYRPGQTVHFKGVWCHVDTLKGDYHALAGKQTTVFFRDPNGKEISKLDLVSNDRGSIAGTFTAPSGSVLGACSLMVPNHGSAKVQVEEYKRPKFFTEIAPPAAPAALGGKVEVKGKAEAYTGAAIDGAKVEWRVTRRTRWPVWIRWCCWFVPPPGEDKEIAHGTVTTGADGSFPIAFTAEPDKSVPPDTEPVFEFEVTADVTDPAGETRSASYSVSVAYTALKASVDADEWVEAGKAAVFKVRTETHDGEGRATEGVLRIHKLKEPEKCPRPDIGLQIRPFHRLGIKRPQPDDKDPTDPDRWELGEVVAELPVKTDDKGDAEVKPTLPAGLFRAVFEAKDANDRKVQALQGFQAVQPDGAKFPSKIPFFTGSPEWQLEPGRTFTLVWGSGHPQARACVEWFLNRRLLKREWSADGRTQQSFTLPIDESMRGGITVSVTMVAQNRLHSFTRQVEVPWSNKELKLRWEHLTSKLQPGAKDTWTTVVADPKGEAVAAEMVATLYDASLDAFLPHRFAGFGGLFRNEQGYYDEPLFGTEPEGLNPYATWRAPDMFGMATPYREFIDEVEIFGRGYFLGGRARGVGFGGGRAMAPKAKAENGTLMRRAFAAPAPMAEMAVAEPADAAGVTAFGGALDLKEDEARAGGAGGEAPPHPDLAQVAARQNLQETAFFHPQLVTDGDGQVRITFTMPEALTKWRFLGFAHDAALRSGWLEGETVTAKDLMVQPNPPRFLREGDVIEFAVKVTNQSDKEQAGAARLTLADAATQQDATAALGVAVPDQDFTVPAKESRTLSWKLSVPDGAGFLTYKAVASSGSLADGEEGWLPVIPRRILVTESMALPVRGAVEKKFDFRKLRDSGQSDTLQSQFVHVQAVSQPAWYAVMALPYLMEFPHECAEMVFNRYYANSLARHIAASDPKIRRVFDLWKGTPALDSPLTKNADLKGILLEETPWLRQANNESQARRNVGLLFDENHMDNELDRALDKLRQMQLGDGLWPWFPGGPGSEYISLYVVTGFARLRALGVETDISPALRALGTLDRKLTQRYEEILKDEKKHPGTLKENHLDPWVAHHLYTRTFLLKDKAVGRGDKEAFDYFAGQARQYWASLGSRMARAHAALALHRLGGKETALLVTRSLKENAVNEEEQGMHWKDAEGDGEGWWWWRAPIETQAMMVEAFREIDADPKAVEGCQVWLLKQKQVQDWRTTKATADAVYALLLGAPGADRGPGRSLPPLLASDALIEISLGGTVVKPEKVEAGTGFYETRFAGPAVKPGFGEITVTKKDQGVSWASVHWQYLEDMEKVTEHNLTPLKLGKKLFVRRNTDKGPVLEEVKGPVAVGDELVTRVVLRNDRAMEFVHLKDLRGSGTEPVNVLSGYRWQDGFGYYEVTRDTASHFFIDRLPAGTHVFETSARVQHAGRYQTGIAEIRCMYAPEFNAHSASVAIEAMKK